MPLPASPKIKKTIFGQHFAGKDPQYYTTHMQEKINTKTSETLNLLPFLLLYVVVGEAQPPSNHQIANVDSSFRHPWLVLTLKHE